MPLKLADLPDDVAELKQLLLGKADVLDAHMATLEATKAELAAAKSGLIAATLETEKLKLELARLKRLAFGQSSERIAREIAQLELQLEEIETAQAETAAPTVVEAAPVEAPADDKPAAEKRPRRQLPAHLPRVTETHEPASASCTTCGTTRMRQVGEDVSEILEYVPGHFQVVRHVRPAYSCHKCETMAQAPMPSLPIPRGQAGSGLIAHILMAKYADHLPLYRQSEMYARDGVELDRGTLTDWVGKAAWLLKPLAERIGETVMARSVIHADDTPVPVLAPGNGKTKTGRLWVYLSDERPHAGPAPPAVLYRYTPDRKGEHCRAQLAQFRGHLHADGYAGFAELYEASGDTPARISEVACWAHARRKFFDVHHATASPIAREALDRIGALFDIERLIAGQLPEQRRCVRLAEAKPRLDDLAGWLDAKLTQIPGKSELAGAIRYARSRWKALTRYADDGRLEVSNNAAENAIRPIALGRKNWLFAGSDRGGERAAIMYTLIRTAKLNGREPEAYLRDLLTRIADHPVNRLDELLPWNIAQPARPSLAA